MQSNSTIESSIAALSENITKFAYETFQNGKSLFGVTHKSIAARASNTLAPKKEKETKPLSAETLLKLRERNSQLLETDWQDARRGIYPVSILFDHPWEDFFRYYPEVCSDMILAWQRKQKKEHQTFAPEIDKEGYPSYYLQNFHYQTDGYLSDMSANLYDLQVELVFNGSADAMRRRILAPLKEGLDANIPQQPIRVLDVACGTGRTLSFMRATLPKASLYGVDLSGPYLRKANQWLSKIPGELVQLTRANAEELPYTDNYFDATTCVFLFHELPPEARQRVINEAFRVTKPGGIFIICDSIQVEDFPEFQPMLDNFPVIYHEPYYRNYTHDNLVKRLEEAGFENIRVENHFVSKYWIVRKPKNN